MTHVNCPNCGHKLLEGEHGSSVSVKCNKCKSIVQVKIDNQSVTLNVVKTEGTTEK